MQKLSQKKAFVTSNYSIDEMFRPSPIACRADLVRRTKNQSIPNPDECFSDKELDALKTRSNLYDFISGKFVHVPRLIALPSDTICNQIKEFEFPVQSTSHSTSVENACGRGRIAVDVITGIRLVGRVF